MYEQIESLFTTIVYIIFCFLATKKYKISQLVEYVTFIYSKMYNDIENSKLLIILLIIYEIKEVILLATKQNQPSTRQNRKG